MRRFHGSLFLVLALVAFAHVEENKSKAAYFQARAPWESPRIVLTPLLDFNHQGAGEVFSVFGKMGKADSDADTSIESVFPPGATDSLRIRDVFDTSFVFPKHPRALMPFAFDRMFSRDTLFRRFYGNGLFIEEYPCADTYILSGYLQHPAQVLRTGMNEEEVIGALGIPAMRHPLEICYRWNSRPKGKIRTNSAEPRYESIRCYFENDSLYAVELRQSRTCF